MEGHERVALDLGGFEEHLPDLEDVGSIPEVLFPADDGVVRLQRGHQFPERGFRVF